MIASDKERRLTVRPGLHKHTCTYVHTHTNTHAGHLHYTTHEKKLKGAVIFFSIWPTTKC